eukprot:COSAG04_NODE_10592_length_766_cov_0.535232_2_plen_111_part_01
MWATLPLIRRPARPDVYKYCSPTRRSFLSGRFPTHINPGGNGQAPICSDYLPLRTTLLSEKLKSAGFGTHFIGKGHLCALPPPPATTATTRINTAPQLCVLLNFQSAQDGP